MRDEQQGGDRYFRNGRVELQLMSQFQLGASRCPLPWLLTWSSQVCSYECVRRWSLNRIGWNSPSRSVCPFQVCSTFFVAHWILQLFELHRYVMTQVDCNACRRRHQLVMMNVSWVCDAKEKIELNDEWSLLLHLGDKGFQFANFLCQHRLTVAITADIC